jgi:hypothetical protein
MPHPMKELAEVEHRVATLYASLELSQTTWLVSVGTRHDAGGKMGISRVFLTSCCRGGITIVSCRSGCTSTFRLTYRTSAGTSSCPTWGIPNGPR